MSKVRERRSERERRRGEMESLSRWWWRWGISIVSSRTEWRREGEEE